MANTIVCAAIIVLSFSVSWLLAHSCLHGVMHVLARRERAEMVIVNKTSQTADQC
jgi:hypothetical protein